ncbi:MAG: hypothetical protein MR420_06615 [Spirochaetia bacterium]|nr:hypothetical protein [Spirochaetia bacterium]
MKNWLYVLILFLPLFLFSCASKPAVKESNDIHTEQIDSENIESLENLVEEPENTNNQIPTEETSETDKFSEDELEEIDEPEIIDLEPEDEILFIEEIPVPEQIEEETVPEQIEDEIVPESIEEPETPEDKTEYNISVIKDENIPEDVINNMIDTLSEENINVSIVELPEVNESDETENVISQENISEQEESDITETIEITGESTEEVAEISDEDDSDVLEDASPITPSRSVTLKKLEYLDVKYPGKGWVFMGTVDNDRDYITLVSGRKLGSTDSNFQFQALKSGTKILHFYKDDPLTGEYIDDYLEVRILNDKSSNKNHVNAPDFKMPLKKKSEPKKASASVENQSAVEQTSSESVEETEISEKQTAVIQNKESDDLSAKNVETKIKTPVSDDSEVSAEDDEVESVEIDTVKLLSEAKNSFNNKKYSDSLNKLNLFLELSTKNRDEALYYKAQILESPGELQNITEALSTYQTLTKDYAASKYWDKANKRIIYLKRFYLEGR